MATLLAAQRQSLVIERLRTDGAVRVSELTRELAVSEMTVRRDLDQLAARGLCRKVHGGACLAPSTAEEPGFAAKSGAELAAKQAIGRAAAALVRPGQSVGISGGTTSYWVAVELARRAARDQITVVTNSLPAAEALAGQAPAQVILTGGTPTPSQALVGPVAEASLARFHLDWLFLGVHGLDPQAGLTTPNLAEAATNQAFMAAARATAVTADASKWGVTALAQIAPLSRIAGLVSDGPPPPGAATAARRHHIDLTIAKD
ncbi:MAG: DeoR/GlpR family DNA-binding transcription regulator [Bifidobacteriaceae bacterium]|jgi:DeoR/GlpR family transcriptional regulator of sugar metabolism|nr:DeoR/GlpR family DNA-binding transcription regulator [Bifidobacteriaceae bacterium]